jgi:hypothetical protein
MSTVTKALPVFAVRMTGSRCNVPLSKTKTLILSTCTDSRDGQATYRFGCRRQPSRAKRVATDAQNEIMALIGTGVRGMSVNRSPFLHITGHRFETGRAQHDNRREFFIFTI